jgi:hypothetical protein
MTRFNVVDGRCCCKTTLASSPAATTLTTHQPSVRAITTTSVSFMRSFHSSNLLSSVPVVRRRRRGTKRVEGRSVGPDQNDNDNTNNDDIEADLSERRNALQHPPVRDVLRFRKAASELLDKLERALMPMKAKNDPFLIVRSHGDMGEIFQLDLGPKEGFYQLEMSEEECIFEYSSPISGKILYCLSSRTGEWVGVDDGNAFEGILVRDLIRQCQGLPHL